MEIKDLVIVVCCLFMTGSKSVVSASDLNVSDKATTLAEGLSPGSATVNELPNKDINGKNMFLISNGLKHSFVCVESESVEANYN